MPLGLKNARATYQRAMTATFHNMLRDCPKIMLIILWWSPGGHNHTNEMRRVFKWCRQYKLKVNPLKYAFGVSSRKFLGFIVHKNRIDLDQAKTKVIQAMERPTTCKQLKSFIENGSYVRRSILPWPSYSSPSINSWRKYAILVGRGAAESFPKNKRCASLVINDDFSNEGVHSLFDFH